MVDDQLQTELRRYDLSGKMMYDYTGAESDSDDGQPRGTGTSEVYQGIRLEGHGLEESSNASVRRVRFDVSAEVVRGVSYIYQ